MWESVGKNRTDISILDKVRVSFARSSNNPTKATLNIYIGNVIAKQLGWAAKERVIFGVWEHNETGVPDYCVFLLTKHEGGFKLAPVGKALRVQITWREPELPPNIKIGATIFASHNFYKGGLRIMLPGYKKESITMDD
jgi:hypothetical protein